MHELTNLIVTPERSAPIQKWGWSEKSKELIDKIIIEWLENAVEEIGTCSTAYGIRCGLGLPKKKTLQEEIALVIKQKEYPKETTVGPYDLDTAERIIAFLKEKGLLNDE